MDEDIPETAPAPSKPSQVPSWVSLGFVLGALFVLALPRRPNEAPPAPIPAQSDEPRVLRSPPQMTTIEAVFAEWGDHAVWSNEATEIALWNSENKAYTDCYEVVRAAGTFYFRSIPRLTRPVLSRGVPNESPLEFTETEQQRQQWLEEVRKQNWKDFSEAARQQMGTSAPPIRPPTDEKDRN
jgi:hypothetical protein